MKFNGNGKPNLTKMQTSKDTRVNESSIRVMNKNFGLISKKKYDESSNFPSYHKDEASTKTYQSVFCSVS